MTMDPVSDRNRVQESDTPTHSQLARWSVGISTAVTIVIALSGVILSVAYAIGGSDAISDNWVGLLGAVALLGGLLASLAAFVLAITAKVRHEQWVKLWLPLLIFPVLLAFIVLGEVLWWE